jgi:hypothetical protein
MSELAHETLHDVQPCVECYRPADTCAIDGVTAPVYPQSFRLPHGPLMATGQKAKVVIWRRHTPYGMADIERCYLARHPA